MSNLYNLAWKSFVSVFKKQENVRPKVEPAPPEYVEPDYVEKVADFIGNNTQHQHLLIFNNHESLARLLSLLPESVRYQTLKVKDTKLQLQSFNSGKIQVLGFTKNNLVGWRVSGAYSKVCVSSICTLTKEEAHQALGRVQRVFHDGSTMLLSCKDVCIFYK